MVERLEHEVEAGAVPADGAAVRDRLIEILAEVASTGGAEAIDLRADPAVLLMVGVNGTGKTTTIGKIAWNLSQAFGLSRRRSRRRDTFRAAAEEQLAEWAERAGAELVGGRSRGADPGAVAYDAISAARRPRRDVVIVDTAGRLHTQDNLMDELAKVRRVIAKLIPERAARDADLDRRDHRAERAAAGEALLRGGRRRRRRADQARRHGEGRHRPRDRLRARPAGEADRRRREARRPAALRPRRIRPARLLAE